MCTHWGSAGSPYRCNFLVLCTSWVQGGGLGHEVWGPHLVEREKGWEMVWGITMSLRSVYQIFTLLVQSALSLSIGSKLKMGTHWGSAGSPYRCNFHVSVYTDQEGIYSSISITNYDTMGMPLLRFSFYSSISISSRVWQQNDTIMCFPYPKCVNHSSFCTAHKKY